MEQKRRVPWSFKGLASRHLLLMLNRYQHSAAYLSSSMILFPALPQVWVKCTTDESDFGSRHLFSALIDALVILLLIVSLWTS